MDLDARDARAAAAELAANSTKSDTATTLEPSKELVVVSAPTNTTDATVSDDQKGLAIFTGVGLRRPSTDELFGLAALLCLLPLWLAFYSLIVGLPIASSFACD